MNSFRRFVALPLFLALAACPAWADGAHIALHATQGGYTVTLFTAPDPLVSGPADLSLLVQDASGAIVSNAEAGGVLALAGQPAIPFTLTRAAAQDKLMLAANLSVPAQGNWTLDLHVNRPRETAVHFSGVALPVAKNHDRLAMVLWATLVPLLLIGLFLANQTAKQQLLAARRSVKSRV